MGRHILFLSVVLIVFWVAIKGIDLASMSQSLSSSIPYYTETVRSFDKNYVLLRGKFDNTFGATLSQYGNKLLIGYAVFTAFIFLRCYRNSSFRSGVRVTVPPVLIVLFLLLLLFFGSLWLREVSLQVLAAHAHDSLEAEPFRYTFPATILAPLLTIILGITVWFILPLTFLFLVLWMPGFCYLLISDAVWRTVWLAFLPIRFFRYLHYLFVPHPAETAYKKGVEQNLPIPELAANVADAMYTYDLKDLDYLPKEWRSLNYTKRLRAFQERLKIEGEVMEEVLKNSRLKARL